MDLLEDINNGYDINWLGFIYRFVVGKSTAPLYYIVVLMQMTVITPWLVMNVKRTKFAFSKLWLITPMYLLYLYAWNFKFGTLPRLYETMFPAWFGFYYLGIYVHYKQRFYCNGYVVIGMILLSCIEALVLKDFGFDLGFYTSQITVGSFLYTFTMIGWLLRKENFKRSCLLSKIGDCAYGMFYIHMMVLRLLDCFIKCCNWYAYCILRFVLTAFISFSIVNIFQKSLRNHRRLVKNIGFV